MSKKTFYILFAVLLVVASFIFLFALGREPFQDYDEATYAHVIDTSVQSGDILSLKISPTDYWFEKPPLQLWASIGAGHLFSSKTFAYRLPAALFGIAGIALVVFLGLELGFGYLAALFAGLILLTTSGFVEAARQIRMDVPVAVSILFSFYCFLRARTNSWWYLGLGLGIGVGVMIKSVIGFFTIPIILIWCLYNKEWDWLTDIYFWLGTILMLAVVLPWHMYESLHFGTLFWSNYLSYHVLARFNENILGGTITNASYLLNLIKFSLPWTIFFGVGLGILWLLRKDGRATWAPLAAIATSVIFNLGVFLYSHTKLVYYFTPLYPFVAIFLVGSTFHFTKKYPRFQWFVWGVLVVLLCVAAVSTYNVASHTRQDLLAFKLIAYDEKEIGIILATHPEIRKTYVYEFPYRETLRYYSGGRRFEGFTGTESRVEPYFIIVPWNFFDKFDVLPDFKSKITREYEGLNLTLLRFVP